MSVRQLAPPLLSVFLFSIGNGLLGLLLVVKLNLAGASVYQIGGLTSAYFAGLALGSFRLGTVIARVGHIRAFAGFAAGIICIYIIHGILIDPWIWITLRFIAGFLIGGLLIVIESWLIGSCSNFERGRLLGIYMLLFYLGYAVGQLPLEYINIESLQLFSVSAMICALSIIPLTIAKVKQPQFGEPVILSWPKLFSMTKIGLLGALTSGMLVSCVYGLLPVFFMQISTIAASDVGLFMAITIVGAVCMQYPIGKLSDQMSRPLLMLIVCVFIILFSVIMTFVSTRIILGSLSFIFGGFIFTLYPLNITHACDRLNNEFIMAGTQSLLLVSSIGATIGPVIGAAIMKYFGANGLFLYFILTVLPLTILIAYYHFIRGRIRIPEEPYISIPSGTTPMIAEIDPRTDNDNN